jgi:hypothetical protein
MRVFRLSALQLLLWCVGGAALVQLLLWRWSGYERFTPIFRYLLAVYDAHGNALLLALAVAAWLLRGKPWAVAAVRAAGERPWTVAALLFPLFCAGSLFAYHDYPLSMDEYSALFQAKAFAAGRLAGEFPPDLLDRLVPPYFQNGFLAVARPSGEVAANYWPGFALLLAPFARLGIPWALNPLLGALAIPAIHRLAALVTGSREAAGWAVVLTVASPVFVATSISYYAMQAHLLANVLYALLLLQPSVPRVLLAGLLGSFALTLHQPVPHLLFALPFAVWLAFRPGAVRLMAALAVGYLPLSLLLGLAWHHYLVELMGRSASPASLDAILARVAHVVSLPSELTLEARLAGLAKTWAWASPGLLVLAAYGFLAERKAAVTVLGASLLLTYFGFFLFRVEHGHGWGYRYLHSAWFVLPLLAAQALDASKAAPKARQDLHGMVAWAIVLSLALANAQRLIQIDTFIGRHLAQVPPLLLPPAAGARELVFVDPGAGAYVEDMVQNDPFLRSPRIVMTAEGKESPAELVQRRFPGYERAAQGRWGELWRAAR